jgi:hypothetical protein
MNPVVRARAINAFLDDLLCVEHHVLDNPRAYAGAPPATLAIIIASIAQHDLPPIDALADLIAWVCDRMSGPSLQPRSPSDLAAGEAAWRLSDALHGKRVTYRRRAVRTDGTTD